MTDTAAAASTAGTIIEDALPFLEQWVLGIAETDIAALVQTDKARFPAYTQGQLVTQVSGDLEHQVRTHLGFLGFLVDVAWSNESFLAILTPVITAQVAGAFAGTGQV